MAEPHKRTALSHLPAGLYAVMAGFAALFVIGAWSFADAGYADLTLVAVTMLFIVALVLPLTLFLGAGRQNTTREPTSLKEWVSGDFEELQDNVKSRNAMVEILLPLGAVSIGIVLIAIVMHLVPHATA